MPEWGSPSGRRWVDLGLPWVRSPSRRVAGRSLGRASARTPARPFTGKRSQRPRPEWSLGTDGEAHRASDSNPCRAQWSSVISTGRSNWSPSIELCKSRRARTPSFRDSPRSQRIPPIVRLLCPLDPRGPVSGPRANGPSRSRVSAVLRTLTERLRGMQWRMIEMRLEQCSPYKGRRFHVSPPLEVELRSGCTPRQRGLRREQPTRNSQPIDSNRFAFAED